VVLTEQLDEDVDCLIARGWGFGWMRLYAWSNPRAARELPPHPPIVGSDQRPWHDRGTCSFVV
jgi:hypothetical protein